MAVRRAGRTPPFRDPDGGILSGSIAEVGFRRLGGVEQWVMVRGEDSANPPLVLLHGGPGVPETSLFRHSMAPLERDFTVVYWEQRGAGKSFSSEIPPESMTVERFIGDLDELVDQVRAELGQDTVTIFGHSWGSALGVLYSSRYPRKVSRYVGSGQLGDWAKAEAATYEFALTQARRLGRRRIEKRLRAIGPPPHSAAELWVQRTSLSRLEGQMSPRSLWRTFGTLVSGKDSSILEVPGVMRSLRWSLELMWDEVTRLNLNELAPVLEVPVDFFLGRNDHWVPVEISVEYFDRLTAPTKRILWFEESGHEPFLDEPDKFNAAMAQSAPPAQPKPGGSICEPGAR